VPAYKASPLTPDDAQKKCDAGNFRACSTLGSWLFYGTRKVTDKKKGEELMRKGCAAGDALGCSMLTNNGIYNYDDARSKNLIHWACEAKEGYGCWLEADYEKAAKYYQLECDAGETGSCIDLALMYRDGHKGVGSDDAKQFALYKKACAAGNADGCDYLAGAYEEGTSVPQSDSQAKANYTKACNMGSSQGCEDLAKLVEDRKNRGIVIR